MGRARKRTGAHESSLAGAPWYRGSLPNLKKFKISQRRWGVSLFHGRAAHTARIRAVKFAVGLNQHFAVANRVRAMPMFPRFHEHDGRSSLTSGQLRISTRRFEDFAPSPLISGDGIYTAVNKEVKRKLVRNAKLWKSSKRTEVLIIGIEGELRMRFGWQLLQSNGTRPLAAVRLRGQRAAAKIQGLPGCRRSC